MATSSLVYTLSNDGTYYIVGTGFTSIADIEADATAGTDGSGLDNTWTGGALEIPATYNSLPVLAIAPNAFAGIANITSVVIENGLTHIGSKAFYTSASLTSLTSVTLPNTLTFLGGTTNGRVFYSRSYLSSINLEDTLITNIPQYTFYNNGALRSITLPNTLTTIDEYAFGSSGLNLITIPVGVTNIKESAFNSCRYLTSVTLPNTLTSIGYRAFYQCSELTSITIPDSVTSMNTAIFQGCTKLTSVTLSNNMTSIPNGTFYNCTRLASIVIPNGVITIGQTAFQGCRGLTSIVIPNGVTSIGNSAFFECDGLTSITIPSSVTSIGQQAFLSSGRSVGRSLYISSVESWCAISFADNTSSPFYSKFFPELDKLYINNVLTTDLVIPNTVTNISNYTFNYFSFLTSIIIPNGVTSIGNYAFNNCRSLTSITIPSSVTSIGNQVFSACIGLTSITVDSNNADYRSVDGVLFNHALTQLIQYPIGNTRTSYLIPNTVSNIANSAFYNCRNLTSITIPDSVISIGAYAFGYCESLTLITIPNSSITIYDYAFYNCTGLTLITIPNNVISIGSHVFEGCSGLTSITIESTTNTLGLGTSAFNNTNNCPIYVYRLSYMTATNWTSYASRMQRIVDSRYIDFVGKDVSSGTTLTQSIPCEIGDKILATIVCRSSLTAPQGWTLVTSAPAISSGTSTQYMYIYSKTAESTTESFTATVASSGRIYMTLINVIDRTWQEISELNTSGSVNANETKTITKSTDNELLYFYSFITGATSGTTSAYSISGDYDIYQCYGVGGRLFFVYDTKAQNTSFTLTRTQNSTSVYNTLGLELIIPSQQTNKVSWGSSNIAFSLGNNKNISISLGNIVIYGGGGQPVVENAVTTADGEILTDANGSYLQFGEEQPELLIAYATAQSGVTYTAVSDLTSYTDAQINEISKAISNCADITSSTATVYLSDATSISVGATRSYTLSTQEAMTDRIIGFNHDTLTSSTAYGEATATGKAGITWQMVDCLVTRYQMNSSSTNAGGWNGSLMRISTLPTIKLTLPQDLQGIIKFVNKKAANGGDTNYSATVTSSDDLFLLAEIEVFDSITWAQDGSNEGTQYEYWVGKSANDRIKYYDDVGTPTATIWWGRSSSSGNIYYFCNVSSKGNTNTTTASDSRGISFAYCT